MLLLDVNIEEGVLAVGGPGAGEDGRPVQEPPDQGGQVHRQAAGPTCEDARGGRDGGERAMDDLERKAAASMASIQAAMVRVGRSSRESLMVPTRM